MRTHAGSTELASVEVSTLEGRSMLSRSLCVAALALLVSVSVHAAPTRCEQILKKIGKDLADVSCVVSTDLTTTNPATTPLNNTIPGLPLFAFTPITDRGVIAPS